MSTVALNPGRSTPVLLRDGSAVQLRALRAEDGPALREFLGGVSPDSLHLRFFGTPDLDRAAAALIDDCRADDFGVVAVDVPTGAIIAHAAWYRVGPARAEAAFLVTDSWHGRGLGSLLLSRVVQAADERGVATLVAETLPSNRAMIAVFERSGYPVEIRRDFEGVEIVLEAIVPPRVLARAA